MAENEQMFSTDEQVQVQEEKKVYSAEEMDAVRKAHEKELRALGDELHDVKVGYALDALLAKSGAKNPAFLARMVNVRDIPLDDAGAPVLSSVSEMLDALRKTDGYLFDDAGKKEASSLPSFPPYRAPAAADEARMSDAEYYAQRFPHR